MTAEERFAIHEILDLHARLKIAERRISYLERDKKTALRRAQKAKEKARYWHGVVLALKARRVA